MSSSEPGHGFAVVLFESVQGAIRAEKLLAAACIPYKLIAVPRQISSNCGFCVRIVRSDEAVVIGLLRDAALGVDGIVPLKETPRR